MILVRNDLCAMNRGGVSPTEMVTVTIPARALAAAADLSVNAVYISTDSDRIPADIDSIMNVMECLINMNSSYNFMSIGDFNLPCVLWCNGEPL